MRIEMRVHKADAWATVCKGCGGAIEPAAPYVWLEWGKPAVMPSIEAVEYEEAAPVRRKAAVRFSHGFSKCLCHPTAAYFVTAGRFHFDRACYGKQVKDAVLLQRIGAAIAGFNRSRRGNRKLQSAKTARQDILWRLNKVLVGAGR